MEVGSLDSLADFDRSLPKLRTRLADRTSTAREKADGATATLVGIFEQFQSRFQRRLTTRGYRRSACPPAWLWPSPWSRRSQCRASG